MLQDIFSGESFTALVVVLFLFAVVVGGLYTWAKRVRERQIGMLNSYLSTHFSISIAELSKMLDKRTLDRSTVLSLARASEYAVLSYAGARVVSYPLMFERIKKLLTDNAVIHVQRLASQWDVSETVIKDIVLEISERDSLDVVLTKDGDYLLVPDFKARMKDNLELHGRLDLDNESQRMRVSKDELVRLVKTWNWKLIESADGLLLSLEWLKGVLERSVERDGYLDPEVLAKRFGLNKLDIQRGIKSFRWLTVSTTDGRFIPQHILSKLLKQKLEAEGILDLEEESERIKVGSDELKRIMKGHTASYLITSDNTVVAISYLRERLIDDVSLLGVIRPEDSAASLGVSISNVRAILENEGSLRKTEGGRYISVPKFRDWMFDNIRSSGTISAKEALEDWGIRTFELAAFLKRFGIRTITTKNDNYLSLSWLRRWILERLSRGLEVTPSIILKRVSITEKEAEVYIHKFAADALMTTEGGLFPTSKVKSDVNRIFTESGVFDIQQYASENKLDASDVEAISDKLVGNAIKTSEGRYLSSETILTPLKWKLSQDGFYDLLQSAKNLNIDQDTMIRVVESAISKNENLVQEAGAIVTDSWVGELKEYAKSRGYIQVTMTAKEWNIRRNAFMALLRRYLKGAYISRSDSYVISKLS